MKGFKVFGMIATLAALAVCASALAQDGPPPQDGAGGPPEQQGMRGGPGQRMGPPPEPLIMRPDVQKELKLTDEQIEKLKELRPMRGGPGGGPDGSGRQGGRQRRQRGGQGQGGQDEPGGPPSGNDRGGPPNDDRGGPPDGGGPGFGAPGGGPRQMDGKLQEILNDTQFKRLKELQLQRMGAEALTRKELADKVGLSDEERQRVRGIVEEARESMPRPDEGQRPDREQMMKAHQEIVSKINDKVFKILTSKERSKWDQLCGKPFRFDESYRPEPTRRPQVDDGEGR